MEPFFKFNKRKRICSHSGYPEFLFKRLGGTYRRILQGNFPEFSVKESKIRRDKKKPPFYQTLKIETEVDHEPVQMIIVILTVIIRNANDQRIIDRIHRCRFFVKIRAAVA